MAGLDDILTPSDRTTVTSVLASLESAGFKPTLYAAEGGTVHCTACDQDSAPDKIVVEKIRRMEGASDPDDMLAIVAARCGQCGQPGAMVLHYGPTASAADADVLAALPD